MITLKTIRIGECIQTIVHENIEDDSLKRLIMSYVDHQLTKGFPFGELLVLHYQLYHGKETEEIYFIAAAVELLILAFDILDDFEDQDTTIKPWNQNSNFALNSTTAMQFLCGYIIRKSGFALKDQAIFLLFQYGLQSINAQHKDLQNICQTESDYIEMTIKKSGSLVALSCLIGASLATSHYPKEIEEYAKYIGLIGQINNDLADLQNWNDKNDLIYKKYTLPIIYLLNCEDKEIQFVQDYYQNHLPKNEIIHKRAIIERKLRETGAIQYTEVIKKIYQNRAIDLLKKLNIAPDYFQQLLKYIL
ncbi:polyprenyl synthetase family protein [Cytobacillus sp. Hz8]|uniref:polyprenyl synthetase family protein n=1 Tax=Cytobacillus sp. Hz8 TaxID=3347168 RepID=UPI0035DDD063